MTTTIVFVYHIYCLNMYIVFVYVAMSSSHIHRDARSPKCLKIAVPKNCWVEQCKQINRETHLEGGGGVKFPPLIPFMTYYIFNHPPKK